MKATQIRELTFNQLDKKLAKAKQDLFNLRFQLSISKLKNTAKIKEIKREIARIMTVQYEREREVINEK